ncbi:MAG: 2-hydroxymuconate tautomerase family protein [Geobacteraceae bacterium]|nr:2-hydroxymuconate tautomerase family protein [Geobacteraceae bacterium]
MPVIRVDMWEGRTNDQKKELVEIFSREMARITGCDVGTVYVILNDVKKDNWGIDGQLCSEKFPD